MSHQSFDHFCDCANQHHFLNRTHDQLNEFCDCNNDHSFLNRRTFEELRNAGEIIDPRDLNTIRGFNDLDSFHRFTDTRFKGVCNCGAQEFNGSRRGTCFSNRSLGRLTPLTRNSNNIDTDFERNITRSRFNRNHRKFAFDDGNRNIIINFM